MDMKELLIVAKQTIEGQRARIRDLEAKVEVVDVFAAALGIRKPVAGFADTPDVTWGLQQCIDAIYNQEQQARTAEILAATAGAPPPAAEVDTPAADAGETAPAAATEAGEQA